MLAKTLRSAVAVEVYCGHIRSHGLECWVMCSVFSLCCGLMFVLCCVMLVWGRVVVGDASVLSFQNLSAHAALGG